MFNPKISVIMPIYNVEDYLTRTLNSILNQSMINNIEVIMIDDGSTDDSRYIIEKFALDYDNFYAYHKKNEGPGIARNYGLNLAKGDYVIFIDSDDIINKNMLEELYNHALKNNNDFVVCNVYKFTENTIWKDVLFNNAFKKILNKNINSTNIKKFTDLVWDTSSSNKLYKKEFLDENNLRFLNHVFFEDVLFSFKSHYIADSIGIISKELYYWRYRSNNTSVTQNFKKKATFNDRIKIINEIHNFLLSNKKEKDLINEIYLKWLNHDFMIYLRRINSFSKDYQNEIIKNISKILKYIPKELITQLNGFYQIIYKYIENNEIDKLIFISSLNNEIIKDITQHDIFIDCKDIDFNKAFDYEEVDAEMVKVSVENNNLIIDLNLFIHYIPKEQMDKIYFEIEDENNNSKSIKYSIHNDLYKLIIPTNFIKKDIHYKIKITYNKKEFSKTNYLKTKERFAYIIDGHEINLGKSINRELDLYSRKLDNNNVIINDVEFDGNHIKLKGFCDKKINSLILEHLMDFNKISYELTYENNNNFTVNIPYKDLIIHPMTKWELKPSSDYKLIKMGKKLTFFDKFNQINFHNQRNKIIINIKSYNIINILNYYNNHNISLKQEINDLNKEKYELANKNTQLNNKINEIKSRKVVMLADKLHIRK